MVKIIIALLLFASSFQTVQATTLETATTTEILSFILNADAAKLDRLRVAFGDKLGTQTVDSVKVWDISPVVDSLGVTTLDSVLSHVNVTKTPRKATFAEILQYLKQVVIDYEKRPVVARADSVAKAVSDSVVTTNEPVF